MRPRNPTTGSAPSHAYEVRHHDGRRVRVYTREWREGEDPRREGLIYLSIQPILRVEGSLMVDAVHPLWVGWTFVDGVQCRVEAVLGPGWTEVNSRRAA